MKVKDLSEKVTCWIAYHLPRYLVYWCAVRVLSHATLIYNDRSPYEINSIEALDAWNKLSKY